jgi:hypothetical protein
MFPTEIVQRITKLNSGIQKFWSKSHGWAPVEAAGLLAKSRLDWQVSLSKTLTLWLQKKPLTPGELILAWSNLGSLVEGTLKTFLQFGTRTILRTLSISRNRTLTITRKESLLNRMRLRWGRSHYISKTKSFLVQKAPFLST